MHAVQRDLKRRTDLSCKNHVSYPDCRKRLSFWNLEQGLREQVQASAILCKNRTVPERPHCAVERKADYSTVVLSSTLCYSTVQ